jgi:hypothetical protein
MEPYNEGFLYKDGKMHHARATQIPWLRELTEGGDDVDGDEDSE